MRYKEFNTNSVLEKCINLFWKGGFGSCPISDIVKETGVNRYSLYEEFDNKEGILSHALQLYVERYANPNIEILSKEGDLKEIIIQFYSSFLRESDKHPPGCFVVHVSTELADHNSDIQAFLDHYLKHIESTFQALLASKGFNESEATIAAKALTTLFCYIMVFCVIRKSSEQQRVMKNEIEMILNKSLSHAA